MSNTKFLPEVSKKLYEQHKAANNTQALYDLLCQPLHEELYKKQDFNYITEFSEAQQMLVCHDYIQNQVLQGGFIQLIQNGYIGLLLKMPAWLQVIHANEMAQVLDDVLKVYVLNREVLDQDYSVEDFAKLYDEFPEFQQLDDRFAAANEATIELLLQYADHHLDEFVKLIDG